MVLSSFQRAYLTPHTDCWKIERWHALIKKGIQPRICRRPSATPWKRLLLANRMNLQCLTITFWNRGGPNFQRRFWIHITRVSLKANGCQLSKRNFSKKETPFWDHFCICCISMNQEGNIYCANTPCHSHRNIRMQFFCVVCERHEAKCLLQ